MPKEHEEDFKSVKKFNVFNTNNLWISLPAIQRVLGENTLDMEIIVNPKQLDGGVNVIQLETAIGAAMKCFDRASGVNVPRSRLVSYCEALCDFQYCSDETRLFTNFDILSREKV